MFWMTWLGSISANVSNNQVSTYKLYMNHVAVIDKYTFWWLQVALCGWKQFVCSVHSFYRFLGAHFQRQKDTAVCQTCNNIHFGKQICHILVEKRAQIGRGDVWSPRTPQPQGARPAAPAAGPKDLTPGPKAQMRRQPSQSTQKQNIFSIHKQSSQSIESPCKFPGRRSSPN